MSQIEKEKERREGASNKMPIVWVENREEGSGFLNQRLGIAGKINPAYELHSSKDIQDIGTGHYNGKIPDIIVGIIKPRYRNTTQQHAIAERVKDIFYITPIDCGGDLLYGDSPKLHLPENHVKGIGVPHAVTKEKIEIGKKEWGEQFSGLPHPKIAVLPGGDCGGFLFTPEKARKMARDIAAKVKELGGSLIITTGFRTSEDARDAFMNEIKDIPAYFYDCKLNTAKINPYFGILGLSDAIIVSGDSQSMCCEANISRKPVYIYTPEGTRKHDAELHRQLYDKKVAKPFADFAEKGIENWSYEPLDTAGDIAKEALKRWRDRQKSQLIQ